MLWDSRQIGNMFHFGANNHVEGTFVFPKPLLTSLSSKLIPGSKFRLTQVHADLDLQVLEVEFEFGSALLEDDAVAALQRSAFHGNLRAHS